MQDLISERAPPDVGSALRNLILRPHLHDRGAVPTLTVRGDATVFGYAIYQTGVVRADQAYDAAMAVACNIMAALCGPTWRPTEVLLSRAKPTDATPYRRFFRAPLRFDADQTALVFPTSWLERRLAGADAKLRGLLEARVEALEARGNGDVVTRRGDRHGARLRGCERVHARAFRRWSGTTPAAWRAGTARA